MEAVTIHQERGGGKSLAVGDTYHACFFGINPDPPLFSPPHDMSKDVLGWNGMLDLVRVSKNVQPDCVFHVNRFMMEVIVNIYVR